MKGAYIFIMTENYGDGERVIDVCLQYSKEEASVFARQLIHCRTMFEVWRGEYACERVDEELEFELEEQ